MTRYNAIGEVDTAPNSNRSTRWLTAIGELGDYAPAVGRTERGTAEVVITVQAEYLEVAAAHALRVLGSVVGDLLSFTIMTTAEYDRRVDEPARPPKVELVGTSAAAAMLGVSRQRVQQLVADNALRHLAVGGKSLAFYRDDIEQLARQRAARADSHQISGEEHARLDATTEESERTRGKDDALLTGGTRPNRRRPKTV